MHNLSKWCKWTFIFVLKKIVTYFHCLSDFTQGCEPSASTLAINMFFCIATNVSYCAQLIFMVHNISRISIDSVKLHSHGTSTQLRDIAPLALMTRRHERAMTTEDTRQHACYDPQPLTSMKLSRHIRTGLVWRNIQFVGLQWGIYRQDSFLKVISKEYGDIQYSDICFTLTIAKLAKRNTHYFDTYYTRGVLTVS